MKVATFLFYFLIIAFDTVKVCCDKFDTYCKSIIDHSESSTIGLSVCTAQKDTRSGGIFLLL